MNLTPEEKKVGQDNYYDALSVKRRDFLKGLIAAGAVSAGGLGAAYFKYGEVNDPVRIGIIGTGDEGGVLIGALNPKYVQVLGIADIRPGNVHRAFHGDWRSNASLSARPGLMAKYGWSTEDQAKQEVQVYGADNGGYQELLKNPDIEAVIIALPLHLHAPVAIEAMMAGKHVLTEKLMAHNIAQCKAMSRVARDQKLHLATGHQRHYSVLYDNAVNMIQWGLLGQIHHIRAQWHRGNLPGSDSWQMPLPGGENGVNRIAEEIAGFQEELKGNKDPEAAKWLEKRIAQWEAWQQDQHVNAKDFGYVDMPMGNHTRTALEELCRWRLWHRTGGGLMAELGSHQLDAASIFISALRNDGKKAQPLSVHAVGGRHVFPLDREVEDHVYCMFEFPGPQYDPEFDAGYHDAVRDYPGKNGIPGYQEDPEKRVIVTYSSINGNGFGHYGEVVMGTKGTLVLAGEKEVMLYKDSDKSSRVSVKEQKGRATLDTSSSGDMQASVAKTAESMGPISRGYTEEIEHWAYCIRQGEPSEGNHPRCHPPVAMADAVIALTANIAINNSRKGLGGYVEFKDEWFDIDSDEVPSPLGKDGKPEINFQDEWKKLTQKA